MGLSKARGFYGQRSSYSICSTKKGWKRLLMWQRALFTLLLSVLSLFITRPPGLLGEIVQGLRGVLPPNCDAYPSVSLRSRGLAPRVAMM